MCPEGSTQSDIDWRSVSKAVTDSVKRSDSSAVFTPEICFRRFVEMSLPAVSDEGRGVPCVISVPRVVTGSGSTRQVRALAATVLTKCACHMDFFTASAALRVSNEILKKKSEGDRKSVQSVMQSGTKSNVPKGNTGSNITRRLETLEEKMKLMEEVEAALEIERERIELDRRVLRVQRAQLAFHQPH
mmetsp:Transcript_26395/g.39165  ORF Transcript_26395/g.39165 Transcript_26395/m.39165 type:complete len:188 (+) Transcript_26395:1812-2375(+)